MPEANYTVYVSHPRDHSQSSTLSPFVHQVKVNAPVDFDIELDTDCDKSAELFTVHMQNLIDSPGLLVVLSDDYFQSQWCLQELMGYAEGRDLHIHAYVVSLDGWLPKAKADGFYNDKRDIYEEFWRSDEGIERAGCKDKASTYIAAIPRLLAELSEISIPLASDFDLSNADCEKSQILWRKLRERIERAKNIGKFQSLPSEETKFQEMCQASFEQAIAPHSQLVNAIQRYCDIPNKTVGQAVWGWASGEPLDRLTPLLSAAREILPRTAAQDQQQLRKAVDKAIGALLISTQHHPELLTRLSSKRYVLDIPAIELKELTALFAEMLFSTLEPIQDRHARISLGESAFVSPERYFSNRREPEQADAVDDIVRMIWNVVIVENIHILSTEKTSFGPDDYRRLNNKLKRQFESGFGRYLLYESPSVLSDSKLLQLKKNLPWLFIFSIKSDLCSSILNGDEAEVEDRLKDFSRF